MASGNDRKRHLSRSASVSPRPLTTSSMASALFPPPSLIPYVTQIAAILTERKQTVCVAETSAGGLISAALLSLPGASKYYAGGLTVYTIGSRIAFSGFTPEELADYR